ncbi:ankyrin protein 3 [Fusarium heterosporum]|uniref:Ankyrin protein 3 n=1 Tax=Fusarium heterosporum TaxID=42747 RepID=A0A8H5WR30_FUSHE|nr:ankyrin protein 3 [Fusarium heterosporum]
MVATQHKNFRLQGIPLEYETRSEVCRLVQKTLGLEANASPTVYSLALSPVDCDSKIATVSFPSVPESLSDHSKTEWSFPLPDGDDIDLSRCLVFDTHFAGFTPFQRSSDEDCNIDVIIVCGLGGHALGSFKEKNGRFVWIRDALPSKIPNARILTYGYNTQLADSRSFQNLTDLGRALKIDLEGVHNPDQPRSILFIGHSLGGLVIKETVLALKEESFDAGSSLLEGIFGFAFFGVPHQGLAVECLVPMVKDNPNRQLLESLHKNSSLLERLQIEFEKMSRTKKFSILSFYETEKSQTAAWVGGKWEMVGPSEVLVDVFSATCGCGKQYPINRNHSEMVKYSGVHDQLYQRVITALSPLINITRGQSRDGGTGARPQALVRISGDERECLRSLSFVEQEHRYSEISYADNTCEWLLEYPQYQAWMNRPRGLFWVKGCPGTGKSVLMKFAVDMMSRRKSGQLVVSFFIHGRGVPLQKTPLGVLRALLNSLLMSFPTYLSELTERFQDRQQRYGSYEQKNGWRWTEKELENLLFRLLTKGTKDQPVVIFIDALDECGEEHAKSLMGSLKRLIANAEREGSLVKICFSSRHFPILGHETMPKVYVEEKNDKDIRLLIEDRLKELRPDERRQKIENEILLKAQGGCQWAILITDMVLDEDAIASKTEDLLSMISSIPPDLDELYNVILNGATEDKHKQMKKLFQWVLFAERPLSAHELREALSTDKDMTYTTVLQLRSHENWSDSVSRFETRVRHISRGLIEFQDRDVYEQYEPEGEEWNREAQFIHQSAADFVAQRFFTHADIKSKTVSAERSGHFEISRSFLKYLALEEILHGEDLSREKLSARFPLMPYGVSFVFRHVRAVEDEGIPQNDLIELIQWYRPENLKLFATIWKRMDPESIHAPRGWPFVEATVEHAIVALGSSSLLNTFLQKDTSDLIHRDSEGNTLLHLALRENYQDLALMILNQSLKWQNELCTGSSTGSNNERMERTDYLAHIHAINHDDETCLALAVSSRADRSIQSLLDAGAEVKYEKSLLFYAISTENKTYLAKLMEAGADLEGAVYFTIQCLNNSAQHTDALYELLSDLLQAGADTKRFAGFEIAGYDDADVRDDEDFNPDEEAIFLALRSGNLQGMSLLLSNPYSATLTNNMGDIPLMIAIRGLDLEAAKILLQALPRTVLWKDEDGLTVVDRSFYFMDDYDKILEWAQLLIDESDGLVTPEDVLTRLIEMGHFDLVEDFVTTYRGVLQPIELSDRGRWILFDAVRLDSLELVSFLVEGSRTNISVSDEHGNTILHLAARKGNLRMAQLLLKQDRENFLMFQEDEYGYTPFGLAIQFENEAMVGLFLDSHSVDNGFQLAAIQKSLSWAIGCRSSAMVKFLVQNYHGVENYQMPFWSAIREGHAEIAKAFLDSTSIDIHTRNKDNQTALSLALESNEVYAIQLVLGLEEFDINLEDEETIRQLTLWAMDYEREDTMRLLLRSISSSAREVIEKFVVKLASWLIEKEKVNMLQLLFEVDGLDLRIEDQRLIRSMFWLAVGKGNDRLVHLIHDSGMFDINTKDKSGQTPLMHIAEIDGEETLRFLLKTGKVNIQATDDEGNTAMSIALKKGFKTIANLLSSYS